MKQSASNSKELPEKTPSAKAPQGTQAVSRAIQLLKLFTDDTPEHDLIALTELSGLNKTTTFRIMSALENEGLIERCEVGYRLGSEAIVLGGRAMRSNNLRKVSRDYLEELSQSTGETVTLEVLHSHPERHLCSLVIDEVLGKHLVGIAPYIGSRLAVHATSTGKVLLAYAAKSVQEQILADELISYTPQTFSRHALEEELKQIRSQGYALSKGELEHGLMTVAAPIFDLNAKAVAAVSIVAPSVRVGESELEPLATLATQSANKISHALGFRN